jgi:hypothetical protein
VMGAAATGDALTNAVTVTWRVRDPWRFMFAGYVLRGVGVLAIGASALAIEPRFAPVAMVASGFVYGAGGSVAYLQMLPFFQTRLAPDDLAAVFRLRYAILAGAAMVGALMAPIVLRAAPPASVIIACGAVLAVTGIVAGARPPRPSGP